MRLRAAHRRITNVVHHVDDMVEMVAKALWREDIGDMRVYLTSAERRNRTWCRVWHEERGFLRAIGRLYPNGKFQPFKTRYAVEVTGKRKWKGALKNMKSAMAVRDVMTS